MTDISVIISAYTEKRWNELCAAVESAQNQTLSPREIIVVVDHNPILLERARAQFSDVIVLENQNTQGASGAKNTGIEAAQGDIIVFLDDDAVATPDWLQMLSEGYEELWAWVESWSHCGLTVGPVGSPMSSTGL
jgi:glycosyltransferase involved in cell wall biosynthesis